MRLGRSAALAAACLAAAAIVPAAAAAQAQPVWNLRVAAFKAPSSIELGSRAQVTGRVAPGVAAPVLIERLEGTTWTPLATVESRRNGRFAAKVPMRGPGSLRASLRSPTGAVIAGRRRFVGVRRRVALRVRAIEYQQIAGHTFTATGRVSHAADGETAVLEGSVNGGRFRALKKVAVRSGKIRRNSPRPAAVAGASASRPRPARAFTPAAPTRRPR